MVNGNYPIQGAEQRLLLAGLTVFGISMNLGDIFVKIVRNDPDSCYILSEFSFIVRHLHFTVFCKKQLYVVLSHAIIGL